MSLYFKILFCTIIVPLAFSFDKKLRFYTQWKHLLPSILVVATFYILCDSYLTNLGVWGFNPRYHSGLRILNLPVEECFFFVAIPYASIFLHEAFLFHFPKAKLAGNTAKTISLLLIILLSLIALFNPDKTYTVYIFTLLAVTLVYSVMEKSKLITNFYITYLVILVPFLIVNGILTGSFINGEVVWYNNQELLGIRIFTIPVEDFAYAFSLIFLTLALNNRLKRLLTYRIKNRAI